MRFCVLGSGSSGNCIYVSAGSAALLVDAGLSGKETLKRLSEVGLDPAIIRAILLTHEHGDHVNSLGVLHRKLKAAVYANSGTIQGIEKSPGYVELPWQVFTTGFPFPVGEIVVEPFTVCHDGLDPVGFIFSAEDVRIGIVTDIGMVTNVVREKLKNCDAIVLEANHDETMLRDADRPWALKQRISGRQGHLSNRCAAELIVECAGMRLKKVFLAHISSDCNKPELAVATVTKNLQKHSLAHVSLALTYPDRPGEVWDSATSQSGIEGLS
ncbi:MAG: MBL fold metallo-hydrolase [bacterium]